MTPLSAETVLAELNKEAGVRLIDVEPGEELEPLTRALVRLAVSLSVTSLDRTAIDEALASAFECGASTEQVQEIVALVAALGVHSIMASATSVMRHAASQGRIDPSSALEARSQALWDRHVGNDAYWQQFSRHFPGFLDAMLRISPDLFAGFFDFCAIPWKSRAVPALTKELAAMACDAAPTHVFVPGLWLHLENALKLGAGRRQILEALHIGASAPRESIVREV